MTNSRKQVAPMRNQGFFIGDQLPSLRSANERMEDGMQEPEIQCLVGEIWKKGELHILFADNGTGKSLLAVQIADALTTGRNVFGLEDLQNENDPLKVLIYDFELSDKQFQVRYTDPLTKKMYPFDTNLFFDSVDWFELDKLALEQGKQVEDLLFDQIQTAIFQSGSRVLIVDNLTYLQSTTTEKTESALALMRRLVELKRSCDLSILVIAHTPKVNLHDPLSVNHLAGSKQISNFADGVSALGKSILGPSYRYWVQIKPSRSGEARYLSENVITCLLERIEGQFLGFRFLRYEEEKVHLKREKKNAKDEQIAMVLDLHTDGLSLRDIEKRTNISKSTAQRIIDKHYDSEP